MDWSTYFVEIEDLKSVTHSQLQLEELLVSLIDLLQKLSILNL